VNDENRSGLDEKHGKRELLILPAEGAHGEKFVVVFSDTQENAERFLDGILNGTGIKIA
jgi:hypothetical protein